MSMSLEGLETRRARHALCHEIGSCRRWMSPTFACADFSATLLWQAFTDDTNFELSSTWQFHFDELKA